MKTLINNYFPELTERQISQFEALGALYSDWNLKINLISRRDIDNLYERHILHSLGISKVVRFVDGTKVMDAGTGGGFPGIPLAILFPEVYFHLVDSTGKKIMVVDAIVEAIGLQNVTTSRCRIEEEKGKFDFVVSRAVMTMPELVRLVRKNISGVQQNTLPNGLLCLKGGDLHKELIPFGKNVIVTKLSDYFREEFFETKQVIYIAL